MCPRSDLQTEALRGRTCLNAARTLGSARRTPGTRCGVRRRCQQRPLSELRAAIDVGQGGDLIRHPAEWGLQQLIEAEGITPESPLLGGTLPRAMGLGSRRHRPIEPRVTVTVTLTVTVTVSGLRCHATWSYVLWSDHQSKADACGYQRWGSWHADHANESCGAVRA